MAESLFECMDVRRKMDHLNDGVVTRLALQAKKKKKKRKPQRQKSALFFLTVSCKLQYIRQTSEGPQCSACGMFVVGAELRQKKGPRRRAFSFAFLGPFLGTFFCFLALFSAPGKNRTLERDK